MKPVIFASSIVDGFRDYRQAAREGIEAGGGRPLLINEDFPSLATSPKEIVSHLPVERPMDMDLSPYFSALDRYSGRSESFRLPPR
jgi:hypothetical protein